jgi:hypothetical protein
MHPTQRSFYPRRITAVDAKDLLKMERLTGISVTSAPDPKL